MARFLITLVNGHQVAVEVPEHCLARDLVCVTPSVKFDRDGKIAWRADQVLAVEMVADPR